MINPNPGDILVSYGKWLPEHVVIVVPAFGEPIVFEYSMAGNRPECVRTNRESPVGVQAHRLIDWLDAASSPAIMELRRPLYEDEIDRLVEATDFCMGRVEAFGESGSPDQKHLPANYVANALQKTGIFAAPRQKWSPFWLIRALVKAGLYEKARIIS